MPMLGIAALALLALGVSCYRPWYGVLLLALMLPFDMGAELRGVTIYTTEALVAALLAAWCLRAWLGKEPKPVSWRELLWAAPFVLALLLSAVNAQHLASVFKQTLRWLELILSAWYVAQALRDEREIKTVLAVSLAVGTLVAGIGIAQVLAGPAAAMNAGRQLNMLYSQTVMRAYSTFGHPNQLAGYLILLLPAAFIFWLEARSAWHRWLAGGVILIQGMALGLTYSRGAWIALTCVSAGLVWLNFKKITAKLVVTAAVLALIGVAGFALLQNHSGSLLTQIQQRFVSHTENRDAIHVRGVFVQMAGQMFCKHPWLGFGAGEYGENVRQYYSPSYYAWEAVNKHVHNLYLQILVECGIAGLIGFLLFVGYWLAAPIRVWWQMAPGTQRQLLSATLAGAIAFLIHNHFDVLTIYARGVHFALILGVSLALARMENPTLSSAAPNGAAVLPPRGGGNL